MAFIGRWLPWRESSPRAFDAEVRTLVQRVALEDLGRRLALSGPIPIRSTRYTRLGGRVRLEATDGSVLELRLFWPRHCVIDTLDSVRFDDRVGWIVGTQSGGDPIVFYAWLATFRACRDTARPR